MAQGTWREDNEENQALQDEFNKTEEGQRLIEEAEKIMAKNPITLGASSFGKTNVADTTALRYPKHQDITDTSDYVAFEFYEYAPPFQNGNNSSSKAYNASVSDEMLGDSKGSILLYMPEDIQSEYGANWGGAGFGLLSKTLMSGIGSASVGNFDAGTAFNEGMNGITGSVKRALVDKIVKKANEAMGTSVTTNQATGGTTGRIVNPNVEMMYESPEMRGFSLNFKMFSSTEEESNEIRKICNTFKKNMLPEFGSAFIKVPNIVKVTFMTGTSPNQFVSQYKPCAITNVSVNYTPDGAWATYRDGRPVATQLTLQFKELKMLFADDIEVGGASF